MALRQLRRALRWILPSTEVLILRAPRHDGESIVPKGFALIHVTTGTPSEVQRIEQAMELAGEPPGLVAPRFAHGDELFAWCAGDTIAAFGWVTYRDRVVGTVRLADAPHRAFLYNFQTLPEYRGRGLYSALLSIMRLALGRHGVQELLIDVKVDNAPSRKGIDNAGFKPVIALTSRSGLLRRTQIVSRLDPTADSLLA